MGFKMIDQTTWKRREYFTHYFTQVPCTYSLTVNIDISPLLATKQKLYPTMLYLLTSLVNERDMFRTSLDGQGRVGAFDTMHPNYTIFHPQSESFSNLWTEYNADFPSFCENYNSDIQTYGAVERFSPKPNQPENTFSVSMIPWTTFTGFQLNLKDGYQYLLPIFTMGKFYEENGKFLLPLAVQVHHSVCDGYHVSAFLQELQKRINTFPAV